MIGTEINSKISAVTVYRGKAQITRETKLSLKQGEHSLIFTGLPVNIDRSSLQVRSSADVILGGCKFETEFLTNDVNERASAILKQRQDLSDELAVMEIKLTRLSDEKAFIEKIATCVTTPQQLKANNEKVTNSPTDYLKVSLWEDFAEFYREQHFSVDSEKLETDKKKRKIEKEIKKLSSELQNLGHTKSRSRDIIKVNINKQTEEEVILSLSYTVPGPTWKPIYNLRFSGNSDKLLFEYDALVSQSTGEDWKDIELKLSTAQISISGVLPDLDPWRISFYHPPAPKSIRSNMKRTKTARSTKEFMEMAAPYPEDNEEVLAAVAIQEASVENTGASVLFCVTGTTGVTGDNSETQVGISRIELPTEYFYRSIPKLSQFAYRTANFTNNSLFPILPGRANIYFDGSMVSTSVFELIMPDQKSDVSLGVDEGIKVEYRFIKKFKKNEGLINKRTNTQFEYCINLENNTNREAEIEIFDQFPISQDKELEVKLIKPKISKDNTDINIDDESKITWRLNLAPSEKRELLITYLVEYPADRLLAGI